MTDRTATIDWLSVELRKLFPNNGVAVFERTILGSTSLHVRYTHFLTAAECQSGILLNDPAYMHFMVHHQGGKYFIEHPTCHSGRVFDGGVVKFRKISALTELAVCEKLLAWFVKHQQHILQTGIL